MRFDIITIFPEIFDSYLKEGLIARAQKKKIIKVKAHNLRRWTKDRHKTVDDRPFGGGLGMVLKVEPIFKAVSALKKSKIQNPSLANQPSPRKGGATGCPAGQAHELASEDKNSKTKIILFTPRGQKFNQKIAYKLSKLDQIIFVCGRYEGVDERVAKNIVDMELSIGDYDLMGGELPAMVVIEAVSRLIPGVLGKEQLLKERITKSGGFIEYAQYTRPEIFELKKGIKWKVPKVLLSGDHKKIEDWKNNHGKVIE